MHKATVDKIKIGVLGFGKHVTTVMLPALRQSKHFEVCAIAATVNYSQLASSVHNTSFEIYNSYEQLINSKQIDAVYVALPNSLHSTWAIKALEAKKHVLIEKPAALNTQEAEDLLAAHKSAQKGILAAFMYRYHPQYVFVKHVLQTSLLGEIQKVEAAFCYDLQDRANTRFNKELSGGALNDVGCYLLDILEFLFPNAFKLENAEFIFDKAAGIDTSCKMRFLNLQGASASLEANMLSPRKNYLKIIGSKKTLSLNAAFLVPRKQSAKIILTAAHSNQVVTIAPANQYLLLLEKFYRLCQGENQLLSLDRIRLNSAHLEQVRLYV